MSQDEASSAGTVEKVPEKAPEKEASGESAWAVGSDDIEYNEYPDFKTNMLSEKFIKRMVGHFNNEDPMKAFEGWEIIAESKENPKDHIRYAMAKKVVEGMPTIEIMGFAEYEGVTAAACWETMENHTIRKDWDKNMSEFHCIDTLKIEKKNRIWHEVCYSKTKFPFPLSARDCVYSKYINLDPKRGLYFCVWRPCTHPKVVKQRKVTRSWSYGAQMMYQMPDGRTRVWQGGCGNPKGNIPAWLINIAMPKLAVGSIKDLRSKTEEVMKKLESGEAKMTAIPPLDEEASDGGASKAAAAEPALPAADTTAAADSAAADDAPESKKEEGEEAPELPQ